MLPKKRSNNIVSEAIRESNTQRDGFVTLSNGVILKTNRVPNMIFMEITRRHKPPRVPVVRNNDIGRDIENPDDPSYIEAYNAYQADVSSAIIDVMIIMGTSINSVPKNVETIDGTNWVKKLKIIGIDPGDDESMRYLMWVKYYAASSDEDITNIANAVGRMSGVTEDDVADAIDQFRSLPE